MRASSERTIGQIIAPTKICNGATRARIFALSSLMPIAGKRRHLVEDL